MKPGIPSPIYNVPFIPEKRIARKATRLIQEYFRKRGVNPSLPIPVELILEGHLGFSISYGELEEEIGSGVLGALLIEGREVRFDASLCNSGSEGRHNFTVGHEIGHLVLHVDLLRQTDFFVRPSRPSIVCRDQSFDPVEVQADKFAAALLMPEDMVREAWERSLSAPWSLCVDDFEDAVCKKEPFKVGKLTIDTWDPIFGSAGLDNLIGTIAGRLAPNFGVSNQAMRIRLEKLGCFNRGGNQLALA